MVNMDVPADRPVPVYLARAGLRGRGRSPRRRAVICLATPDERRRLVDIAATLHIEFEELPADVEGIVPPY